MKNEEKRETKRKSRASVIASQTFRFLSPPPVSPAPHPVAALPFLAYHANTIDEPVYPELGMECRREKRKEERGSPAQFGGCAWKRF